VNTIDSPKFGQPGQECLPFEISVVSRVVEVSHRVSQNDPPDVDLKVIRESREFIKDFIVVRHIGVQVDPKIVVRSLEKLSIEGFNLELRFEGQLCQKLMSDDSQNVSTLEDKEEFF